MKPTDRLPIEDYKDIIKQAVAEHDVVVITAETGAGKSTQVPQYLMEAGHQVVVTQPRRLAARTVAARVAEEISYRLDQGEQVANTRGQVRDLVGYRTAFERKDSPDNKILFCTDGLQMVRELVGNQKTDVLIIDEVHEWNINIETLVAWTRQQISEGRKMKLVLMSATMEADKLAKYYGEDTPVISVPGRLYPVSEDQVGPREMIGKIQELVKKGRNVLVFQPGKKEIEQTIEDLRKAGVDAEILPLHGGLEPQEQQLCFRSYNKPKVVVSTNVAQTSVTIPDIDAVVDSGMERRVELSDGIEGLYLKPISNADRMQRKGRAGRVKEGEYILASEYGAEDRPDFPKAEIERSRLDQLVLRLAAIGFDATKLEFFHQPEKKVLDDAKRALHALGAMDDEGQVTKVGRLMSKLPLSVQYSRMLVEAEKKGVIDDVLTIVSILEVGGLRDRGDAWKTFTQEKESDILAELDLWKAAQGRSNGELHNMGIFAKSFYRVKELRRKLEGEARRHKLGQGSSGDRQAILKSCVAGMVDHLYQNRYGEYRNGDNSNRQLARESVITGSPDWIVGQPKDIQFKNRKGRLCTLNLVDMASKVDPQWLLEVAPHLASSKQENYTWSNEKGEVVAEEVALFDGNEVGRKPGVSAQSCDKAYQAMASALIHDIEQFPAAVAEACKRNEVLVERSNQLRLRSKGEVSAVPREDLLAHYAAALEIHGILSKTALQAVMDSGEFEVADMEMNLESYISAEEQARIEAENPLEIEMGGNLFAVRYTHDYNGYKATVEMTLAELHAFPAGTPVEIPSQRQLTLKISDQGYTDLSATKIGEMQEKAKERRLDSIWKAFCKDNTSEKMNMKPFTELPGLPEAKIFDEKTGAVAYPALTIDHWGGYRIGWHRSLEEAISAQKSTEDKQKELNEKEEEKQHFEVYKAEAEAINEELGSLMSKLDANEDGIRSDYGFESGYAPDLSRMSSQFRNVRYDLPYHPLKTKEKLLDIKQELKTRFEAAAKAKAEAEAEKARIDQLVEAGEVLVNFGGHFRVMGATGQAQYWVIRADGSEREADEIEYRKRYTGEGEKKWKLVNPDELALSWFKDCTSEPHMFNLDKSPVDQYTPQQLATIQRLQQEIAERWQGQTGMSGNPSPGIEGGWNVRGAEFVDIEKPLTSAIRGLENVSIAAETDYRSDKQRRKEESENRAITKASEVLANQAEAILGTLAAIVLLEGELNAPYGRGRRQDAVKDRLGEPAESSENQFYSFGTARMVDGTLMEALSLLRAKYTQQTPSTTKNVPTPVYSDEPSSTTAPDKPASLADLMGKFGKAAEPKPARKEEPVTVATPQENPVAEIIITQEEPAFKPLSEMGEEEVFEEYEANEQSIQALLTENPELEMVFSQLEQSRSDLAEAELKLERAIARRDRADANPNKDKKKAKQEKEKLKAVVENLREERKAFKLRVQDLEKKSHSMQQAKEQLDTLRTRQAQIEEIL